MGKSRVCSTCKVEKELEKYFHVQKSRKLGRSYVCKECVKMKAKVNSEHIKKYQRSWRSKNKQTIAEYQKKYRVENREALDAYAYIHRRKWNKENKSKKLEYTHKRLALKRNQMGVMPQGYEEIMLDAYETRSCMKCGEGADIQVDHIVPASKGGLWCLSNFQFLCRSCNISKGNRDDADYRTYDQVVLMDTYVAFFTASDGIIELPILDYTIEGRGK